LGLRTESMPDNFNRIAIFDGPILLAGNLGPRGREADVPVFVSETREVISSITPVPNQPLIFRAEKIVRPGNFTLKPFYQTYANEYSVYWETLTESSWTSRQAARAAGIQARQEIEMRTVDWFQPGEMQPERDHNVQGEKTDPGEFNGRKFRHAVDGGWFSFEMKVAAAKANQLICTWWGSENGLRTFDILVDGQKLATQTLLNNQPGQFWETTNALPAESVRDKQQVTVKFAARPGNFAGGLYGCRMVRAQ